MSTPGGQRGAAHPPGAGVARGSLTVAVGLGITGAASLAMIGIVDHALPVADGNAFNQWWLVTTLLVTPFGVFEAYLARLVAAHRAAGEDPTAVVADLVGRTWLVAAVVSVGAMALGPWLTSAEFGGHVGLTLLLPVWVFVLATQAVQRGFATGAGRYSAIAVQLGVDGVLRIVLTTALAAASRPAVEVLAAATCLSAAGGIAVAGRWCPGWYARPRRTAAAGRWGPILLLLVASACPVLAGSAPAPWLNAVLHHRHQDTALVFAAAVTLSRVPSQFVSAAFGPLLSHLTHAVQTGDRATYDRLRRRATLLAALLGAVFVLAFAGGGGRLLAGYSGQPHAGRLLGAGTLAVLAAASALMMLAVVQQAGLAAADRWNTIAASWVVALVSLVGVLLLPLSALWRATLAPAAAIGVAFAYMAVAAARAPGQSSMRWGRR